MWENDFVLLFTAHFFFTTITNTLNEMMASVKYPPTHLCITGTIISSYVALVPQIISIEHAHMLWWLPLHPSAHNNKHNDELCFCSVICFTRGHYTSPPVLCE